MSNTNSNKQGFFFGRDFVVEVTGENWHYADGITGEVIVDMGKYLSEGKSLNDIYFELEQEFSKYEKESARGNILFARKSCQDPESLPHKLREELVDFLQSGLVDFDTPFIDGKKHFVVYVQQRHLHKYRFEMGWLYDWLVEILLPGTVVKLKACSDKCLDCLDRRREMEKRNVLRKKNITWQKKDKKETQSKTDSKQPASVPQVAPSQVNLFSTPKTAPVASVSSHSVQLGSSENWSANFLAM